MIIIFSVQPTIDDRFESYFNYLELFDHILSMSLMVVCVCGVRIRMCVCVCVYGQGVPQCLSSCCLCEGICMCVYVRMRAINLRTF